MTTIDTHADAAGAAPAASTVASFFSGLAAWTVTTDHKKIGRIYLGAGLLGMIASTVLAALLGTERMDGAELLDAGALIQLFQAQRIAVVFAGLVPIALGLAIAVVPLQLGARQMAFPRLALAGCYGWLGGLALTYAALGRNGGIGGGDDNAVDLFLAGHGLMLIGLTASAGALAASILTTRAPGMTMRRVPLMAWSALIGSIGLLLALPVAFGSVVYLYVDHRLGLATNFGGAAGVGEWIGWAMSTPAVALYALPAVGVASELIPVTFKRRPQMRGVLFAGIALIGVTALAAVTRQPVQELSFDADQSFGDFVRDLLPFLVLTGLPLLGLLIVLGMGGLTAKSGLAHSKPRISAAFVFSFIGLGIVALGLLANAAMAITDLELVGTTWEEGTTTLLAYGATLALLGGVAFWAPKLWGRSLPDKRLLPLVLPGLGGAVLAGVAMCIAGALDQAGGIPADEIQVGAMLDLDVHGSAELFNALAALGHLLMLLTVLAFTMLLLMSAFAGGEQAADNPVGGHTAEWGTSSPAPEHNYAYTQTVASATPQFDMTYEGSLS